MATLPAYTFGTRIPATLATVRPRVEAALRAEGFGVLTEIDVQATLKAKLGVERDEYARGDDRRSDGPDGRARDRR